MRPRPFSTWLDGLLFAFHSCTMLWSAPATTTLSFLGDGNFEDSEHTTWSFHTSHLAADSSAQDSVEQRIFFPMCQLNAIDLWVIPSARFGFMAKLAGLT